MKRIGIHMPFPNVNEVIQGMTNWKLNTLQIATRNMRNMQQRRTMQYDLQSLATALAHKNFGPLVMHAPYALNPASPDDYTRERCRAIMQDDMNMMPNCDVRYVIHPGSSMNGYWDVGMRNMMNVLRNLTIPRNVTVCVETMAGCGTQLMCTEEQIAMLEDSHLQNVGICFDSCHVFAAGLYCTRILERFLPSIKVIHLNGSEGSFGSRVDRHAPISDGFGLWQWIARNAPDEVPIILETPTDTMGQDVAYLHKILS